MISSAAMLGLVKKPDVSYTKILAKEAQSGSTTSNSADSDVKVHPPRQGILRTVTIEKSVDAKVVTPVVKPKKHSSTKQTTKTQVVKSVPNHTNNIHIVEIVKISK